ncbi:hypothetical protein FQA47_019287 [Oryzias melastigma]|uniref:Uncharacterized protein n=1 Tax=Oryzias melastigma TaxID=30732 RepID=A0A834CEW8_ORYME|nr:hypothetical protein FQA47_019287 [Oryzias melastigma]
MEDLRYCVLCTFARPSSLLHTSLSHLLTSRKCFPPHTSNVFFPHGHQINPSHSASISCWGRADGAVQEEEKPVIMCIQLVRFKCWLSAALLIDSFGFLWSGALTDILSPQSTHCSSFIASLMTPGGSPSAFWIFLPSMGLPTGLALLRRHLLAALNPRAP